MKSHALVQATHYLWVSVGDAAESAGKAEPSASPLNSHTHPRFDVFGRKVMALLTFSFFSVYISDIW